MIALIMFAIVGLGLFAGFLGFAVGFKRGRRRGAPDSSVVAAVGHMVRLEGLAFPHAACLLDDSEYRLLTSNPYLQEVAKRFRRERQDLAIAWISMLQGDMKTLWRFHRFLIRQGAPARFQEELQILQTYVLSVVLLSMFKLVIASGSSFALARSARRAERLVGRMSTVVSNGLVRIPQAGWPELERSWASAA
jgi:hypothetical protein